VQRAEHESFGASAVGLAVGADVQGEPLIYCGVLVGQVKISISEFSCEMWYLC
jgi:hypothetical protein